MMLQLADFNYYTNEYGGSVLSEEEFYRVIGYVSSFIQLMTFGRAKRSLLDCVKDAACAGCEKYVSLTHNGNVKSENTDGYSVTYEPIAGGEILEEMNNVIAGYLAHTGMMNRL